jgi:site-specific recombinase XerD
VKGVKREGTRTGNWLTLSQAETFINSPDVATLKGRRDRALLAIMIGSGLRREETASLTLEHIQQREGRWVIVDLIGEGGRMRTVPMPSWAKASIDDWTNIAGFASGRVFRPVNKGGRVSGDGMTAQSIFETVKLYAEQIGLKGIAPHDLRRTFAKLAHKGRAALEQIQLSLGHASIQTTERYLGVQQDLTDAPCDHLGLKLAPSNDCR